MPKTLQSLDSLIARLLRTETLIAIVVIALEAAGVFATDEQAIGGGAVAVAVFLGRSIVKATGYTDAPDAQPTRNDDDAIQV